MAGSRRRGRSEITQPRYLGRYRAVSTDCETSGRNHHFRQRPARNSRFQPLSRRSWTVPRWAGALGTATPLASGSPPAAPGAAGRLPASADAAPPSRTRPPVTSPPGRSGRGQSWGGCPEQSCLAVALLRCTPRPHAGRRPLPRRPRASGPPQACHARVRGPRCCPRCCCQGCLSRLGAERGRWGQEGCMGAREAEEGAMGPREAEKRDKRKDEWGHRMQAGDDWR